MRFILPCAYDDTCVSKIAFKRTDCRVDLYIYYSIGRSWWGLVDVMTYA
jgi:hypothetical protein